MCTGARSNLFELRFRVHGGAIDGQADGRQANYQQDEAIELLVQQDSSTQPPAPQEQLKVLPKKEK